MRKITKSQIEKIKTIMSYGGAMPSGDWTTGRGNYINKMPIPPLFTEIYVYQVNELKGFAKKAVTKLLKKRPRIQRVIVPQNIRAVNKVLKQETE